MPFPSFFKSCLCCDTDNDGKLSWKEVIMSAEKVLDFLNKTAQTLSLYSSVLEAAGVDMGEAKGIFNRINNILSTAGKGIEALNDIKVSIARGEVGDINGDGVVNREDVKIYFKGAQDISQAIAGAGIRKDEMASIQSKLQRMIDAIDGLPTNYLTVSTASV